MNAFSIVLFIHVLSAIALFVAMALEGVILFRFRSATSLQELRFFTRLSRRLGIIYGPAFIGILFGGIYLASQLRSHAAWIPLALGATLLLALIGGVVTGRILSRLRKALSQEAVSFGSVSAQARSKSLVLSYGFRAGLALGIVFLMSATPGLIPSITALVLASGLGIAIATRVRLTHRMPGDCDWRDKAGTATAQQS
jgi:hypothetical protein